ncbi:MAG: helix-turn-helix transcriptional regulator [Rhodospirillales bacterium]
MNNRLLIDRRSGLDRRGYGDRRQGPDRRSGSERRHLSGAGDRRSSGYYDARASNGDVAHGQPPLPVRDNFGRWGVLLADLVAGFYAACLEPAHWPDILVRLKDAVRADVCALGSHDFASGTGRLDQAVNIDPGFIAAYGEGLARHNPWLHQQDRLPPPGSVRSGQMLAEDTELLDGPFYREWLEPQNLFHHIFGILDSSGSAVDYLFFARSREKGAFWDDDLALLSRLLPNLRYGLQAGRTLRRSEEMNRLQAHALDVLPIGVMILSTAGQVMFANRLAREIINGEPAFYVGNNGLGLRLAAGRTRFRDIVGAATLRPVLDGSGEIHATSVAREGGGRPLTVMTLALDGPERVRAPTDPAAIVFVGDPERPSQVDSRRLIRLYGLSRAEARVAVELAKGQRLDQVAEALGLTYETVRKHLKQIFSKTFTDRQAELVRTMSLGPAGLRL